MTQPEKPESGQSPSSKASGSDAGTVRIALEDLQSAAAGSTTTPAGGTSADSSASPAASGSTSKAGSGTTTSTASGAGSNAGSGSGAAAKTEKTEKSDGAATKASSAAAADSSSSSTGSTAASTAASTAGTAAGAAAANAPTKPAAKSAADGADVTSSAPPPWQRVAEDARYAEEAPGSSDPTARFEDWGYQRSPRSEAYPAGVAEPVTSDAYRSVVSGTAAAGLDNSGRTTVNLGVGAGQSPRAGSTAAPSALRRPGRGPRRASLQVKRVDPWSVLKLAFVLSVALFFVWLVAVGVLYGVLDGMGVWDKLNGTYTEFAQNTTSGGGGPLITATRVFGIAAVIGAINIVLITALATVGAFVYNVSADLAGGLEVTLAERE